MISAELLGASVSDWGEHSCSRTCHSVGVHANDEELRAMASPTRRSKRLNLSLRYLEWPGNSAWHVRSEGATVEAACA